ncbi:MAG: ATP-binding protein [Thermincola sp.]|jgi:ATP-binding protein involved in chromosome partitioning|nr:ATP-binding protein [Thermincola sp.]MDT3703207.1 ATP-binding protein [Thermincola sp.]
MSDSSIKEEIDLIGINVDTSCSYDCANCERYFECKWPQKEDFLKHGFYPLAKENLKNVKRKILVLGGKGGVGKSMLATNLAAALAKLGKKVCVLDQNYDCPAVPIMLGVEGKKLKTGENGFIPVVGAGGVKVVSMGLILSQDEIIIWFHDSKRAATEEFLTNVDFGELDYLIFDIPAGTSSETVNVMKLIPDMDGSIVITVPSEVSQNVAKRAILVSQQAGVPVLGVIENMGSFTCPDCGEVVGILQSGGGQKLASDMGMEYWGSIPMDLEVSSSLDHGNPFVLNDENFVGSQVVMTAAQKLIKKYD